MEPEDLSPRTQAPATCPYPETDQTSPCNKANSVYPEGVWCTILSQSSKVIAGYFLYTKQKQLLYYSNLFFSNNYLPILFVNTDSKYAFFFMYLFFTNNYLSNLFFRIDLKYSVDE
jgi:hypothetical protein